MLVFWGVLNFVAQRYIMNAMVLEPQFVTIVLGTAGGLMESNLSSYLLAPTGSTDFVALDAGTLLTGLQQAKCKGNLSDIALATASSLSVEGQVLTQHIKAYLLSHAHLDHLAGLVLNSPEDVAKHILALPSTIDHLRDHVFNEQIWPNFGDEGAGRPLKKYHFVRLHPGHEQAIAGTPLTVTPFVLCHAGAPSTAFLLQAKGAYALYMGDTGPDEAEQCDNLYQVWQAITPLIRQGSLRGLFLEISYPNGRNVTQLYGHLTPLWLMKELHRLAALVNPQQPTSALSGITVIVSHIKPTLQRVQSEREQIIQQVAELNDLGIRFLFPEQGDRIEF
jgi:3',5'-cyclic-nucleotide phosphodiesterase